MAATIKEGRELLDAVGRKRIPFPERVALMKRLMKTKMDANFAIAMLKPSMDGQQKRLFQVARFVFDEEDASHVGRFLDFFGECLRLAPKDAVFAVDGDVLEKLFEMCDPTEGAFISNDALLDELDDDLKRFDGLVEVFESPESAVKKKKRFGRVVGDQIDFFVGDSFVEDVYAIIRLKSLTDVWTRKYPKAMTETEIEKASSLGRYPLFGYRVTSCGHCLAYLAKEDDVRKKLKTLSEEIAFEAHFGLERPLPGSFAAVDVSHLKIDGLAYARGIIMGKTFEGAYSAYLYDLGHVEENLGSEKLAPLPRRIVDAEAPLLKCLRIDGVGAIRDADLPEKAALLLRRLVDRKTFDGLNKRGCLEATTLKRMLSSGKSAVQKTAVKILRYVCESRKCHVESETASSLVDYLFKEPESTDALYALFHFIVALKKEALSRFLQDVNVASALTFVKSRLEDDDDVVRKIESLLERKRNESQTRRRGKQVSIRDMSDIDFNSDGDFEYEDEDDKKATPGEEKFGSSLYDDELLVDLAFDHVLFERMPSKDALAVEICAFLNAGASKGVIFIGVDPSSRLVKSIRMDRSERDHFRQWFDDFSNGQVIHPRVSSARLELDLKPLRCLWKEATTIPNRDFLCVITIHPDDEKSKATKYELRTRKFYGVSFTRRNKKSVKTS